MRLDKSFRLTVGYDIARDWHLVRLDGIAGKEQITCDFKLPGGFKRRLWNKRLAEADKLLRAHCRKEGIPVNSIVPVPDIASNAKAKEAFLHHVFDKPFYGWEGKI